MPACTFNTVGYCTISSLSRIWKNATEPWNAIESGIFFLELKILCPKSCSTRSNQGNCKNTCEVCSGDVIAHKTLICAVCENFKPGILSLPDFCLGLSLSSFASQMIRIMPFALIKSFACFSCHSVLIMLK